MGWQQLQKITKGGSFGESSSIDGNYAIVGDPTNTVVYWFQRKSDGSWEEVHSVTKTGGVFGGIVSISGNYAIVGDSNNEVAYWFQRKSDGSWEEVHSVTKTGTGFPSSLAISGNYAIVGDLLDDSAGTDAGKVYWYQRKDNGSWEEIQTAVGEVTNDGFGDFVDISGNYAIISASNISSSIPSKVYWYQRNREGNWELLQRITKSNLPSSDPFIGVVAISGNYAIAGFTVSNDGFVSLYQREGDGNWKEIQIISGTGGSGEYYGASVDISGNYAIVGAFGSSTAYWYQRQNDGVWREFNRVTESGTYGDSVNISGGYAIVGDSDTGAAYLYQRNKN